MNKSLIRGVVYGVVFVGSYILTNIPFGAELFGRLDDWSHVGRALFSFTVGYWCGKLVTVLVK